MKKLHVDIANCSHKKLVKIAKQCGFSLYEGRKHTKIKQLSGEFITMIPRHSVLSKPTAKGIVEAMNAHGANIDFS